MRVPTVIIVTVPVSSTMLIPISRKKFAINLFLEDTLKGSRTPAACLEGKHDNRFTISVDITPCGRLALSNKLTSLVPDSGFNCSGSKYVTRKSAQQNDCLKLMRKITRLWTINVRIVDTDRTPHPMISVRLRL